MDSRQREKPYQLRDLIEISQVQSLAEKYFEATGFPMSIIDHHGRVLVSAGSQRVCSQFHRVHKASCAQCIQSDLSIYGKIKQDTAQEGFIEYKCKNGLREIAIPIIVLEQVLGACYVGQFFYNDEPFDRNYFLEQAHQFGFNEDEYLKAIFEVPIFSRQQIRKIVAYNKQLVLIITDLTRKTLETQNEIKNRLRAEESNKAKSLFLASMSHEIRTPMNAIIGMSEILMETELSKEQRSYLHTMQFAGQSLLDLINSVLDIAKIESSTFEIIKDNFELHSFLRNICQVFAIQAQKKNINLELKIDQQVPIWIQEDSARLKQVLINLIGNAMKFTQYGSITLHVTSDPDLIYFEVIDTGVGIPAEDVQKVFEKFYQVTTDSHSSTGIGLGLTICKQIIELLKGQIKIKSSVGMGTTVSFSLPLKTVNAPPKMIIKDEVVIDSKPRSILLAEDMEDNRVIVSSFLANTPWNLDFAKDGEEALSKMKERNYDIVLMDVQMPIMSGYEAVEAFRTWESKNRTSHTPILALTANALSDDMQKSLNAGCDGHLTKPFRKKALLAAIMAFTSGPTYV